MFTTLAGKCLKSIMSLHRLPPMFMLPRWHQLFPGYYVCRLSVYLHWRLISALPKNQHNQHSDGVSIPNRAVKWVRRHHMTKVTMHHVQCNCFMSMTLLDLCYHYPHINQNLSKFISVLVWDYFHVNTVARQSRNHHKWLKWRWRFCPAGALCALCIKTKVSMSIGSILAWWDWYFCCCFSDYSHSLAKYVWAQLLSQKSPPPPHLLIGGF